MEGKPHSPHKGKHLPDGQTPVKSHHKAHEIDRYSKLGCHFDILNERLFYPYFSSLEPQPGIDALVIHCRLENIEYRNYAEIIKQVVQKNLSHKLSHAFPIPELFTP